MSSFSTDELADDVAELSDRLLAALTDRLGPDISKGMVYVVICAQDGKMKWVKPTPKLPRRGLASSS